MRVECMGLWAKGAILAGALAALLVAVEAPALDLKSVGRSVDVDEVVDTALEVYEAFHVDAETEARLGREVAAYLIARCGLYADEALTRYVGLVGMAVARKAERRDVRYRFGVLDTDAVGAFAAPGGYVFVTRGLLSRLRNEAQLAGVLAHEIAHVDRKHAVEALGKTKIMRLGAEKARSNVKRGEVFDRASGFLVGLADKGFSREDELDADAAGAPLAGASGYDGSGLYWALKQLYGTGEGTSNRAFLKRHPPLSDRLGRLEGSPGHRAKGAVLKGRFLSSVSF
ncbi:MAG: M48 family metalloprotease [Elusimicrobiota bacterium]